MNLELESVDIDVLSILEQEICVDAKMFAGTQMLSWTMRVNERRSRRQGELFHADMLSMKQQPGDSDTTFHLDLEACNCEL